MSHSAAATPTHNKPFLPWDIGFIGTLLKIRFFCVGHTPSYMDVQSSKEFPSCCGRSRLGAWCSIQRLPPWYHLIQIAVFATEKRPLSVPRSDSFPRLARRWRRAYCYQGKEPATVLLRQ
ncbi:MAG: hypothetical protein DMG42_05460 [Acidobacteria bacterium]|nr:MAG: hypothetical protein DMG42_05460 [Acidobacteriota bacterium]